MPSAWDARNDALHQRWKVIGGNANIEADAGPTENALAKKILVRTLDGNYTAKLGQYETSHLYFTSGNYHDLANQPENTCFIHWHSSFAPKKYKDGEE